MSRALGVHGGAGEWCPLGVNGHPVRRQPEHPDGLPSRLVDSTDVLASPALCRRLATLYPT